MAADDASSAEMHRPPTNRDADPLALDEDTVEQLLTGALPPTQAPAGYARVAQLLAAAAAAPTPGELAGRGAALAELRAVARARPAAAGPGRAGPRPRRRRRTGLAVVVVVGALATGGAAGAATGHLPGPAREVARSLLGTGGGQAPSASTDAGQPPAPVKRPAGAGGGLPGSRLGVATSRGLAGRPPARTWRGSARLSCPGTAPSRAGSWTRPSSRLWPGRPVARSGSRPTARTFCPATRSPNRRNQSSRSRPAAEGRARAALPRPPAAAARVKATRVRATHRTRLHRRPRRTADGVGAGGELPYSRVVTRTVLLALLLPECVPRCPMGAAPAARPVPGRDADAGNW